VNLRCDGLAHPEPPGERRIDQASHMRVGRYDHARQFDGVIDDTMTEIRSLLLGGAYGVEGVVADFEHEFAAHLGSRHAIGVNTGTDALVLALQAAGIRPGDDVVTQANTFHATVAAIVLAGARPVLVDADPDTMLMDIDALEACLTSATRAIIPVHLYGKPLAMSRLAEVAASIGAVVVEDAAQAHGARLSTGEYAGTLGLAGCFSFHPSKNLAGAGDGGMIVTDDDDLAEDLTARRTLGQRTQNEHVMVGLNSKLQPLQAVVLRAKLPALSRWNERRAQLAREYRARLEGLPLSFQADGPDEVHAYHLLQVRSRSRDPLLAHLRAAHIDAVVRYPVPVHLQPAFERFGWRKGEFPVAERLADECLCLPLYPEMGDGALDYVTGEVRAFFDASREP
jgi:dTDP-4-amino-4,6-dideoxygalactose transaminase